MPDIALTKLLTGNLSDSLLVFYRFKYHLCFEAVIVPFSVGHRLKTPFCFRRF